MREGKLSLEKINGNPEPLRTRPEHAPKLRPKPIPASAESLLTPDLKAEIDKQLQKPETRRRFGFIFNKPVCEYLAHRYYQQGRSLHWIALNNEFVPTTIDTLARYFRKYNLLKSNPELHKLDESPSISESNDLLALEKLTQIGDMANELRALGYEVELSVRSEFKLLVKTYQSTKR